MKISGQHDVEDWKKLRKDLIGSSVTTTNWEDAFDFFYERINTRFLKPINTVQTHGDGEGEGFSIVSLQCILIEFLEVALYQGKNHTKKEIPEPNEYKNSGDLFAAFLTKRKPFESQFAKTEV